MVEPTVVRRYAALVVAEAAVIAVVAIWWFRLHRRLEWRPQRWRFSREYRVRPEDDGPRDSTPK